jgi:hypothetical protein
MGEGWVGVRFRVFSQVHPFKRRIEKQKVISG